MSLYALKPDPEERPALHELNRADREPADRPLVRDGHRVVSFLRYEPVDHLAADGVNTLCGQPFEVHVVRSPRPTCEACSKAAES